MSPGPGNFVSLNDGTCDQTKELKTVAGIMPNDDKWVFSSSGRHMFVSFLVDNLNSWPGFIAKIHYGNEFNKQHKNLHQNINFFSFS